MNKVRIDNHEFTLFRDYDRGDYHRLTFSGKISYLRQRVDLILIRPCQNAMEDAQNNNMGLIVATAICAGISAASTFLHGKRASEKGDDRRFFNDFVKGYMSPVIANESEWLYRKIRCGLSHNFTILEGGIEVSLGSYVDKGRAEQEMDPQIFLDDFAQGWSQFLDEVRREGENSHPGKNFVKRFDEIFRD